jgi:hypothetical protein
MENRKRVTEEDLLRTEALIAESYGQMKQSVIQAPSRALRSAGQTARQHPYATAGMAIVAGVALYGIYTLVTSGSSSRGAPRGSGSGLRRDEGRPDLIQQLLPMLIPLVVPLVVPYVGDTLQKYLGKILTENRN